ncbi:MAG TPA: MerR family transcriptional regulator [Thermoanaerobaculia bacterium]|nr:MerR family transcriptional regulator [Thermoanaerobaculia bacterium]
MAKKKKQKSYKVGDACNELDIQPYVLRYWETEFPFLRAPKGSTGPRVYSEDELASIRRIKELLYDEGYTIAGAKKKLEAELESGGPRVKSAQRSLDEAAAAAADETVADEPARGSAADPDSLDTAASERIETIARGLRSLRDEAREVLQLLRGSADR